MILGVTGSFGAGKGAFVDYLTREKGFVHYSASGFITEEIEKRGLPVHRDSMRQVANELRDVYGSAYIIESLYERAKKCGHESSIIESLRARSEVAKIKALGGFVIGIDAPPRIRYERTQKRGSNKDHVDFDTWCVQEKSEMNPDDPSKQDIFGALADSDTVIVNEGSLTEFYEKIDRVLRELGT